MDGKSKLSWVFLNRVEEPIEACKPVLFWTGDDKMSIAAAAPTSGQVFWCYTFEELRRSVSDWLRTESQTAPKVHGGYDKVPFVVQWANGLRYSGRHDLQLGGEDFWTGLRQELEVYSCRRRPLHFDNDAQWRDFSSRMAEDGSDKTCGRLLDECEF